MEEAGLAHPSVPDHRHHLPLPGASLAQGLVQGHEFRLPPHERGQLVRPRPAGRVRAGPAPTSSWTSMGTGIPDGHWP